jgi:hypothetical protein
LTKEGVAVANDIVAGDIVSQAAIMNYLLMLEQYLQKETSILLSAIFDLKLKRDAEKRPIQSKLQAAQDDYVIQNSECNNPSSTTPFGQATQAVACRFAGEDLVEINDLQGQLSAIDAQYSPDIEKLSDNIKMITPVRAVAAANYSNEKAKYDAAVYFQKTIANSGQPACGTTPTASSPQTGSANAPTDNGTCQIGALTNAQKAAGVKECCDGPASFSSDCGGPGGPLLTVEQLTALSNSGAGNA